jgi:hypothetical protein
MATHISDARKALADNILNQPVIHNMSILAQGKLEDHEQSLDCPCRPLVKNSGYGIAPAADGIHNLRSYPFFISHRTLK